jgi:tetratricopeptide (TPR) repeat protein
MRARTAAFLLGGVLVLYLGMCLWKGVLAVYDAFHLHSALSGGFGAGLLVFGFLGAWFLVREIQFGFTTERLAVALDDSGELGQQEIDALPRSPGGRVDRAAADRLFARRKAETEAAPDDWRAWYRLAAAYSAAKDSSRARAAMRHAIRLYKDVACADTAHTNTSHTDTAPTDSASHPAH